MGLPWSPVYGSSPHNPPLTCPCSPAGVEQNLVGLSPQEASQAADPGCGEDREAVSSCTLILILQQLTGVRPCCWETLSICYSSPGQSFALLMGKHQLGVSTGTIVNPLATSG